MLRRRRLAASVPEATVETDHRATSDQIAPDHALKTEKIAAHDTKNHTTKVGLEEAVVVVEAAVNTPGGHSNFQFRSTLCNYL